MITPTQDAKFISKADKKRHGRSLYGSRNHQSKLSESDVAEIRRRCASGAVQVHVAKQFKISAATLSKIVLRQAWKHVA